MARSRSWPVLRVATVLLLSGIGCTAEGTIPTSAASSSSTAGVVTLEEPRPEILRFCQRGADRLGWPVPCPGLLPAHHLFANTELCRICLAKGIFLLEEVFEGPPSYVGMPDMDGSTSNVGHLNIWSVPRERLDAARLGCPARGRAGATVEVGGEVARWVICPAVRDPPQDSGHVMLEWSVGGIVYAVSVHTDSREDRRLALLIAQSLVFVEPGGGP